MQVRAIDADSEPNAEVVYAVESTIYVRGEREDPAEVLYFVIGVMSIRQVQWRNQWGRGLWELQPLTSF